MNSSNTPAVKTKDEYKTEITLAVQNSTLQMLIDNLAAANVEIARLNDRIKELEEPDKP